jgi:predicted ATPase
MLSLDEERVLQNCTLQHFKSVYDRITLPLAPLTIFAGANSSGKSTVIQSLLLTAQTVQSPVRSRSIVLNGHILKLGEFKDVLSYGASTESISLGFSLMVPRGAGFARGAGYAVSSLEIDSVDCEFSFCGRALSDDDTGLRRLQPWLETSRIRVGGGSDERQEVDDERQEVELAVRRAQAPALERLSTLAVARTSVTQLELASLEYEASAPTALSQIRAYFPIPRSSRAVGASLLHFIPSRLTVVYDTVAHQEDRIIQLLTAVGSGDFYYESGRSTDQFADISQDILARLQPVVVPIISEYISEAQQRPILANARGIWRGRLDELAASFTFEGVVGFLRSLPTRDRRQLVARFAELESDIRAAVRGRRQAHFDLAMVPLPLLLDSGVEITTHFFTRYVKYLGPLRDEPKPVYPLAGGADPKDIGYRGEHTAAVLETYRNTSIIYHPPTSIERRSALPDPVAATLHYAVLDWLRYMGIADDVRTADLGKLGHELKVAAGTGDVVHDLTHVGVGVSQVLPILVLALLAESGSTLIFEQPELHLHPRVQTRLADFFVSLSALGKQCLVETHSEYLINRLRFRAAVSDDDTVSRDTLLYFVEREKGRSHYRPIRINQYGVINEWPAGFFDETEDLAASILEAGAGKRRLRAQKRDD